MKHKGPLKGVIGVHPHFKRRKWDAYPFKRRKWDVYPFKRRKWDVYPFKRIKWSCAPQKGVNGVCTTLKRRKGDQDTPKGRKWVCAPSKGLIAMFTLLCCGCDIDMKFRSQMFPPTDLERRKTDPSHHLRRVDPSPTSSSFPPPADDVPSAASLPFRLFSGLLLLHFSGDCTTSGIDLFIPIALIISASFPCFLSEFCSSIKAAGFRVTGSRRDCRKTTTTVAHPPSDDLEKAGEHPSRVHIPFSGEFSIPFLPFSRLWNLRYNFRQFSLFPANWTCCGYVAAAIPPSCAAVGLREPGKSFRKAVATW
ncbi:hypothetical protein LXL04_029532 [Taraxacum kok-saghyz]